MEIFGHIEDINLYCTNISDRDRDEILKMKKIFDIMRFIIYYVAPTFAVIGLLGNICVCLVIIRSKAMHTVTNCYLFSLSTSDLILLISGLILDENYAGLHLPSYKPRVYTEIPRILATSSMSISIMISTAFTIERYLAICHPLYCYKTSEVRRAVKVNIFVWIICFLLILPVEIMSSLIGMDIIQLEMWDFPFYYTCFSSIVFFVMPVIIMMTLYIMIGYRLRKRKKLRGEHADSENSSDKTSFVLMGTIILVTIICWTPTFLMDLMITDSYLRIPVSMNTYLLWSLYYLSRFFLQLSPVINPIIYNALSSKFREAFKEIIIDPLRKLEPCRRSKSSSSSVSHEEHQPHGVVKEV